MSDAVGSQMGFRFIEELIPGITPTTGTVYDIKAGAETMDAVQDTEFDPDITDDGQKESTVRGLNVLSGGFSSQLGKGAYDAFFRSLMRRKTLTTNTFSDTVSVATAPGDITAEITFSGAVSISGMIAGGPIKLSGFTDTDLNDIFYVVSASGTTGKAVIGRLDKNQDLSGISESGTAATITQTYVKSGGREKVTFTIEKANNQIGADKGIIRLKGEEVNSVALGYTPGSAPSIQFDFMGLSDELTNDAMLSPYDWVADGVTAAAATSIAIKSGTTDPTAGDIVYFADDSSKTGYVVSSYSGGQLVISPALAEATTDGGKLYFMRPGSNPGNNLKMENNLGRVVIDGAVFCLQSADVNISSNLTPTNCIGDENATTLNPGEKSATGTISANYDATVQSALVDKVRAKSTFSLSLFASDTDGNIICVQLPRAEGTKELIKRADQNAIPQNIPFKGLKDSTTGAIAIIHILNA